MISFERRLVRMHVGSSWTTNLGKMHGHIKSLFDRNRAGQTLGKAHLAVGFIEGISAREKVCNEARARPTISNATHPNQNNICIDNGCRSACHPQDTEAEDSTMSQTVRDDET